MHKVHEPRIRGTEDPRPESDERRAEKVTSVSEEPVTITKASPDEFKALMDRLLEGIKAHADAIVRAHLDGDIAVVFFEVKPEGLAGRAAWEFGWSGSDGAARMTKTRAAKIAAEIEASNPGDKAGIAWLRSRKTGRIFVLTGDGNLMVNYDPGKGYSVEPGTLDGEWKS